MLYFSADNPRITAFNIYDFVAAVFMQESGYTVNASKIETDGDFVISKQICGLNLGNSPKFKIEVGGKEKILKKSDWVIRNNTDYPSEKAIPLWLLAMGW